MAAGTWNMQKASGGVASITIADGVGATNIVLPESGTVATTATATETSTGLVELATTAEAQAGIDDLRAITPLKLRNALNASGTAPIYACRAWVNFNGTGTVAIRASGNVSSITDNGAGDYTVNFTTAMPDNNYIATVGGNSVFASLGFNYQCKTYSYATSNCKVTTPTANLSLADWELITIQVTR